MAAVKLELEMRNKVAISPLVGLLAGWPPVYAGAAAPLVSATVN